MRFVALSCVLVGLAALSACGDGGDQEAPGDTTDASSLTASGGAGGSLASGGSASGGSSGSVSATNGGSGTGGDGAGGSGTGSGGSGGTGTGGTGTGGAGTGGTGTGGTGTGGTGTGGTGTGGAGMGGSDSGGTGTGGEGSDGTGTGGTGTGGAGAGGTEGVGGAGVGGTEGGGTGGAGVGGTGGGGTGGAGVGGTGTGGTGTGGAGGVGGGTGGIGTGGSGGVGGGTGGVGGGTIAECNPTEAPAIDRLGLELIVEDERFERLIDARQPPGSDDWYLVDQIGLIYIYRDGQLLDEPFLDLVDEIFIGAYPFNIAVTYDDRGLVGLEFAPDYAESGKFYVAIIPSADGVADQDTDLVREYQRSSADPDLADPAPTKTLLALPSAPEARGVTFTVMHNTSTLRFGPDGMLYVATGDGGTATCNAAQPDAPQTLASPFGKMLRLDPNAEPPYVAAGNPFIGVEGADPRVLHYGLRNPFRFSIDSLTGDLYIGDVGQSSYEEVSYAPAEAKGLNFGWAAFEGYVNTCSHRAQLAGSTHTEPFFVADRRRSATGPYADYRSPIAGPVYRGDAIPELYGAEIFGDFDGARMNAIFNCGPAAEDRSPLTILRKSCDPNYPREACLVPTDPADSEFDRLYAIVEGNDRELYMVVNHRSLRKIVPNPER